MVITAAIEKASTFCSLAKMSVPMMLPSVTAASITTATTVGLAQGNTEFVTNPISNNSAVSPKKATAT